MINRPANLEHARRSVLKADEIATMTWPMIASAFPYRPVGDRKCPVEFSLILLTLLLTLAIAGVLMILMHIGGDGRDGPQPPLFPPIY